MSRFSLRRFYTFSAVLLAILPLTIYLGLSSVIIIGNLRDQVGQSVDAVARSVSFEVQYFINSCRQELVGIQIYLSADRSGEALSHVGPYLDALSESRSGFSGFMLLSLEGKVLHTTEASRRFVGLDFSGQPSFQRATETPEIVFSEPFISALDGIVTVAAYKKFDSVIIAAYLKLDILSSFISSLRLSSWDQIAVVDYSSRIIAHTERSRVNEQRYLPSAIRDFSKAHEGDSTFLVSSRPVDGSDWRVVYYRDQRDARKLSAILILSLGVVGFFSVLLAVFLALRLRRNFSQPLNAVLESIKATSDGRYEEPLSGNYVEEFSRIAEAFNTMVVNVRERDSMILKSLEEKTILLKEVHHRVKNNLQIISSLLNMQEDYVRDPWDKGLFAISQRRIHSMAIVHELLYQTEHFSSVDMGEYARHLINYLLSTCSGDRINIDYDLAVLPLPLDKAMPCALILNEMATNALKYAASLSIPEPSLRVLLACDGDAVLMELEDHGPGLPEGFSIAENQSLGYTLISSLAAQLQGSIAIRSAGGESPWPGLVVSLRFPLQRNN